jgi:hypothetical protein
VISFRRLIVRLISKERQETRVAKKPEVRLSKQDKKLLKSLERVFGTISFEQSTSKNAPKDYAVLTDPEMEMLADELESYIDQNSFVKYAYFIDNIFSSSRDDIALREIYLSERKKRGRSRAMASQHWSELKSRLGLLDRHWASDAVPMNESTFLKLEKQLIDATIETPGFRSHIMTTVAQNSQFRKVLTEDGGQSKSPSTYTLLNKTLGQLRSAVEGRSHHKAISASRISAIGGLLIDCAAMFTTRDWSTAATHSGLATTAALAITPD